MSAAIGQGVLPINDVRPVDTKTEKATQAVLAIILTFLGHASIHASRKAFAAAHKLLEDDWDFSHEFLGILDTVFMLSYGAGLLINGHIAERMDPLLHLLAGYLTAAGSLILFAFTAILDIPERAYSWYVVVIIIFAFAQSVSLPVGVKIVSGWVKQESRGSVFGIWATHSVVGNIFGLALASGLAAAEGEAALVPMLTIPSVLVILTGVLQYMFLSEGPYLPASTAARTTVSLSKVLELPNVSTYAVAFSGIRTVDISLFFWVVLYLSEQINLSESTAALVAITYDAGLTFGAYFSGKLSDRLGSRPGIFSVSLLLASILAVGLAFVKTAAGAGCLLFFLGLVMGGPVMLMPTVIAADIGSRSKLSVTATIVGIVDGAGSVSAAAGQVLVGYLSGAKGWTSIFLVIMGLLLLGSILCYQIYSKEDNKKGFSVLDESKNADIAIEEPAEGEDQDLLGDKDARRTGADNKED